MKQVRSKQEVLCYHCKKPFFKEISELKRNEKLGRNTFCSISCAIKHRNTGKPAHYKLLRGYNISDQYTPFRYTFRNAKRRNKEFNLTLQDLKDQWDKQNGICPYSGVSLILPKGSLHKVPMSNRASLDRIDSKKGYIPGNIQFVSTLINFMKAELSHEETVNFCLQISKNYCSGYPEDQTISSPSLGAGR